jgi:hypothetical protein
MNWLERLVLLLFFAGLLALLGYAEPEATAVGAVAGLVPAVVVAARLKRLSERMDAKLAVVETVPKGFRPMQVVVRGGVHLALLAGLLVPTIFLPFIGDELFAGCCAAVTAFAATVTASKLRAG